MRDTYHEALDSVTDQLVAMTRTVSSMIDRASAALLEVDLGKAESVIATDEDVDQLNIELEQRCTGLLALQQPVATDLRLVTGALRMSTTLERMGDLARHIAKIARMRYPDSAVPAQVRPLFEGMADLASHMASLICDVIANQDLALAYEVDQLDDRMDELHRQLLQTLMSDWQGTVDQAVDLTLTGRFYERFADHIVSLARRIVYTTTGTRYDELEKEKSEKIANVRKSGLGLMKSVKASVGGSWCFVVLFVIPPLQGRLAACSRHFPQASKKGKDEL